MIIRIQVLLTNAHRNEVSIHQIKLARPIHRPTRRDLSAGSLQPIITEDEEHK